MRLAVWRCFLGRPRSSSRIRSMTPVKGSSLGLLGGDCRRYPGGTENTSILRTVSRWSPNTREASRMLIPSTITALRTRRYTSTLYIHHTIHGFGYNPMNDGGRYSIQSPFVSNLPPAWSTLPPPITSVSGTFRALLSTSRCPPVGHGWLLCAGPGRVGPRRLHGRPLLPFLTECRERI